MTQAYGNLIAGDWRKGERQIENVNPSDLSDVVGLYAQADAADLEGAIAVARAARPACRAMGLEARQTALEFIGREELFAPAAAVQRIGSYEEGLSTANDTEFGLVAGIFTSNLARATYFRRNVATGCVTVNLPTAGTDYHVPFGGRKNSSSGPREQDRAAAEFYTQMKTSSIRAREPA